MGKQQNHYLLFGLILFAFLTALLKDPFPQSTVIFDKDGNNTEMFLDDFQGSIYNKFCQD